MRGSFLALTVQLYMFYYSCFSPCSWARPDVFAAVTTMWALPKSAHSENHQERNNTADVGKEALWAGEAL